MTERTAVYRLFSAKDELLYVGVSKGFGQRWIAHAHVQPWWPEVARQAIDWFDTRDEALAAETHAIREEHPLYNIVHNQAVRPRAVKQRTVSSTGFPHEWRHPRLTEISDARRDYDRVQAKADRAHEQLMLQVRKALDEAKALPVARKRELGPSAIGRAAKFTREYISQIRDGKHGKHG